MRLRTKLRMLGLWWRIRNRLFWWRRWKQGDITTVDYIDAKLYEMWKGDKWEPPSV